MSSDAKKKVEEQLDEAALELQRIERAIPVFIENAHFISGKAGGRAVVVMESNPGMVDKRGVVLRWFVPARGGARRIRLDALGAFVAEQITGRMSSRDIISAFHHKFGCSLNEARESCLLFLRSLAKRGVISMVEKER